MISGEEMYIRIAEKVMENPETVTLYFSYEFPSVPGQFVMVDVPGKEEIPVSLSSESSITVKAVGDTTQKMLNLGKGTIVGIRGPYGNGFKAVEGNKLVVGGGIGIAPLRYLVRWLERDIDVVYGVKTVKEFIFFEELRAKNVVFITENGSFGEKGTVIDILESMDLGKYDQIYVCGPEMMIASILNLFEREKILPLTQISVERYMKCGIGICGSCCIDPFGLRVCVEGPVFNGEILKNSEIGKYHRNGSGRKYVWKN